MVSPTSTMSITQQCELLALPRASYYFKPSDVNPEDLRIMNLIDQIYLEFPCYGTRKMAKTLSKNYGLTVGRKKVRRLMALMGINAIYPKPRLNLSLPGKGHQVYPYLLRDVAITNPNQVWCSDITYIRLDQGFVYLTAIMDWHSRKVLAWRLSNSLTSDFCREAIKEAIDRHGTPDIFNSDQGSQYTSTSFTQVLKDHGVKMSMDGKGRFMDNIFIERLWRTVKQEEVYLNAYQSIKECKESLTRFFDKYNTKRIHQTLDYMTPDEVYFDLKAA